ncbi:MAG TPA: hypothetical protein ENK57_01085 [Polyangiaceae bacterium]|nr:hypothetical protein [Polyangiaceae bacterium]
MKSLVGIGSVWVGCCIAWVVLGSTLLVRSDDSSLTGEGDVHQLWGPPTQQRQPTASFQRTTYTDEPSIVVGADGISRSTVQPQRSVEQVPIPVVRSQVEVDLALEHRRRGLQWYPTYTVDLEGQYTFQNTTDAVREVAIVFPLSASTSSQGGWSRPNYGEGTTAAFDNFVVRDSDGESIAFDITGDHARWTTELQPGASRTFTVQYRGRGTERWQYQMGAAGLRSSDA